MASKAAALRDELAQARKDAREFWAKYPDPADAPTDEAAAHNKKMEDLHAEAVKAQELEVMRERAMTEPESEGRTIRDDGEAPATKAWDLETALRDNEAYMRLVKSKAQVSGRKSFTLELAQIPSLKTLVTLSDINVPASRRPGIVPFGVDETTVGDLMLQGTTDNNTITYMEETTFTNAAATVAEGAAKPESAVDFTERTDNVRKIATWIPVTDELLADVAGFRSYLEGRLRFMVERAEEDQLLNGDGTAPNISGILDRSGLQTVTSTNDVDSIYRAITEVRVDGFAEPTALVIHPLSWANIRLAKDSNNQYFGPGPFAPDRTETLWGLPVRVTPLIAEGTALVGAFRPYAQIFRREGVTVTASTEHSTYFTENKVAVLAEERLALAVYRPAAFCKITGLASS